jgi:3-hydroxyacyl-CoA dehydrogenase
MAKPTAKVTVIGTGVIGASWAALFLAHGLDVVATDVAPGADEKLRAFVDAAWPTLEGFGLDPDASRDRLRFEPLLENALDGTDFVQENGPERLPFKQELYEKLDALLEADVIIASSSSGLTMSEIQRACRCHPERCLIGHPFNPPHLIPLVELVGGELTSEATIEAAAFFYEGLGKKTVRLHKEVPGHVANRLQAALFREVAHLIGEGVVSVADADVAVSYGPGLRWGIMGPSLLYHLGGGPGGIEHFFEQFTGPLNAWFGVLGTDKITPELSARIIAGVKEEVDGRSFDQLAAERDRNLVGLLKLRAAGNGS